MDKEQLEQPQDLEDKQLDDVSGGARTLSACARLSAVEGDDEACDADDGEAPLGWGIHIPGI